MVRTLICALGAPSKPYAETRYGHGGREVVTRFAPVAVAELVGDVERVLVVVTPTVAERRAIAGGLDELRAELAPREVIEVSVPEPHAEGSAGEAVGALLAELERLPRGAELVVDLTLAFRSLPFLLFAAVACAREIYKHRVTDVLYAAFEGAPADAAKPLIELREALELYEWVFALRALHSHADASSLVTLVKESALKQQAPGGHMTTSLLVKVLEKLAGALSEVLPVEEALAARPALAQAETLVSVASTHAVGQRLLPVLRELTSAAAPGPQLLPEPLPLKEKVQLTRGWLAHQLDRIAFHAQRGRVGAALRALSEWLISRVVLARGQGERWLQWDVRSSAGHALNGAHQRRLSVGNLSDEIKQLRNPLAHAGLRPELISPPAPDVIVVLVERCRALLPAEQDGELALQGAGAGVLLVSSLGKSPGLLYSALLEVKPTHLLLVTSASSREALAEIRERAASSAELVEVVVERPFHEFDAARRAFGAKGPRREELLTVLDACGARFANLTGGTTAMQASVEWLAREAERLDRRMRRIAFADARTPDEQRREPWVQAPRIVLEDEDGA
ncbi:MAG: hypothetical protein DYH12_30900 [Sorangiineae bacterium PRO1]|nr:hypothetical protein [Sorangiineae bacterium PRO1]